MNLLTPFFLLLSVASVVPWQGLSAADHATCPMCQGPLTPVCASDGNTYWNEECAKCFNPQLVITRKGFCPRLDLELEG